MKQIKKSGPSFLKIALTILLTAATCFSIFAQEKENLGIQKQIIIEDFDSGSINLTSYPLEDKEPSDWELNSVITYENSPWSLKVFGNTWKVQSISPVAIDTGDVWQVSAYIASKAEIQGFALMDGTNVLFYSFAGSEELNIDEWVPVYQGFFPEDQWNDYQLPIADDWMAFFGYLPQITEIVYINDKDDTSQGVIFFDNIINISNDLPHVPEVSISFSLGESYFTGSGSEVVDVQFLSEVTDPDSDDHDYFWDFGDDSTSTEKDPLHTFLVSDDHPYRVLLEVVDSTGRWGRASISVDVDPGSSSLPVTLNFVGDIMLARKYEFPGGIIPTQGVEALFAPTKPILGDAADITVANLECPLTNHSVHHPTKSIYFKGSPENVDGLTFAGIDIVTLANNHILDYLYSGLEDTQEILEDNNILHVGAGADSYESYLPAFYSKSGLQIAFLGASDRTGQYNNYQPYLNAGYNKPGFGYLEPYYIKKQIEDAKEVSDLVVMQWHTGREYSFNPDDNIDSTYFWNVSSQEDENYYPLLQTPDPKDRETAQYAIDNGADLVICHHPHIMQGVELYNDKLIAHSLGDFVFDLDYPETYPSFILNTQANESGFFEFTLTPIYIDDYIPQRANGALGLHILDNLAQSSKLLNTYLSIDRDSIVARVVMDTTEMPTTITDYDVELSLDTVADTWITPPCKLNRSGSISTVNSITPDESQELRLGRELIWFGNMEDEGSTLWNLNSNNESYCDTVAFSGNQSIEHLRFPTSSSNIVTNLEERMVIPSENEKYSLGGYIKTRNGANVTIQIKYYESRSSIFSIDTEDLGVQIDGDSPWTFYHKELAIPSEATVFDIRLYSGIPDADTAFSWFDNISLIQWSDWDEYEVMEPIPVPNDYYYLQVLSFDNGENITVNYSETAFGLEEHFIETDLAVFLEGPFNGSDMNTYLTNNPSIKNEFPLLQPYSVYPWEYPGTESIDSLPNSNIVDWVLVEFRDAESAASASEATIIHQQAGFLISDGSVVDIDGVSNLYFNGQINQQLFTVIRHRNHVDVITANPLIEIDGIYCYDFTNSINQVLGGSSGFKSIGSGKFGMAGGDADPNGIVDAADNILWEIIAGEVGYFPEDQNLDGQVNNIDKDDIWVSNAAVISSQVPE